MGEARIIRTTETALYRALDHEGTPVVAQYERLKLFLESEKQPELANLFAEPVLTGPKEGGYRSVTWYSPMQGQVVSLEETRGDDRTAAEQHLRQLLSQAQPYLNHPEMGPLLKAALMVPSLADCLVIFGKVLLVNWGFVPPAAISDADALQRHWRATLGGYTPAPAATAPTPPPLAAAVPPGEGGPPPLPQAQGQAAAPQGRPSPAPGAAPPLNTVVVRKALWYRGILGIILLVLLLIMLGLGIYWLLTGSLPRLGGLGGGGADGDSPRLAEMIEMQNALNKGLEDNIQRLKAALEADPCTASPGVIAPLARAPLGTVEGEAPAAQRPAQPPVSSATPGQAVAPASPDAQAAPPAGPGQSGPGQAPGEAEPARPQSLATLLERATVLVVAPAAKGKGGAIGTGFFVSPDVVATNRHVLAQADKNKILVTSKALGGIKRTKFLAASQEQGRDYALLKVEGVAPEQAALLRFAEGVNKLDNVVAAGYPGLISSDDPKFLALLAGGDRSSVPELVFSSGEVAVVLERRPAVVVHTAVLSSGNSGGPLVDRCGRVVGINTLIKIDENSRHQGNYSLAAQDLLAFLRSNGITPTVSGGKCSPPAEGGQGR